MVFDIWYALYELQYRSQYNCSLNNSDKILIQNQGMNWHLSSMRIPGTAKDSVPRLTIQIRCPRYGVPCMPILNRSQFIPCPKWKRFFFQMHVFTNSKICSDTMAQPLLPNEHYNLWCLFNGFYFKCVNVRHHFGICMPMLSV